MKHFLLLLGTCAGASLLGMQRAEAGGPLEHEPLVKCESPEKVAAGLKYCSDNVDAVNKALDCYDLLQAEWDNSAEELNRSLLGNQKRASTRQQGEVGFSERDYKTSSEKMKRLVETTRYNLEVISLYSRVMLDYVNATSEAESATCYNENVGRLSLVKKDFAKMIAEGEAAIKDSSGLEALAAGYKKNLDVSSDRHEQVLLRRLSRAAEPPTFARVPAGKSFRTRSDITGIQTSRDKDILSDFELEGQLAR